VSHDRIKSRRTYSGPGVYVGRPSKWGNPFTIGPDGTRDEVIDVVTGSAPPHPPQRSRE